LFLYMDPVSPSAVPEIIDPVFTKTRPKRSFCMTENERFGLVFTKTGSINSGTVEQFQNPRSLKGTVSRDRF
jgi:hypothetical protein